MYHQVRDPYELVNLAGDPAQARRLSSLQAQMYAMIEASGVEPERPQGRWVPGLLPDVNAPEYVDNG